MSKERLYQITTIGSMIPWALLLMSANDLLVSYSVLLFQLVCLHHTIKYEKAVKV